MMQLTTHDRAFYGRWILANGWSEAMGLGTTFGLGTLIGSQLDRIAGLAAALIAVAVAVLFGTLLEGVLVGYAQESVLRTRLSSLRRRRWILATAIGAGLAWLLGMIPSTIMTLQAPEAAAAPAAEPAALLRYALAVVMGAVAGPVLGVAQWTVLRRHVRHAARWLWANAAAWAVGMPLVFLGMDFVPWDGPRPLVFVTLYVVCGIAGLVVGAVHGRVLVRLVAEAAPMPTSTTA
jgi:hypothetical protein